jgi:glycosyltransferase involved in cell wall biosynthesis
MPVFNAGRFLTVALDSVLAQTEPRFEFIIVDDGSRDLSPRILADYARRDARLRIVTQENRGVASSLNAGLAHCTGEFIFRMDADDLSLPTRLAVQWAEMQRRPACVALGAAVIFTDSEARPLKKYCPPLDPAGIEAGLTDGNGGALVHPTVVFRRAALLAVGGYREKYDFIEDLDLYVRLLEHGGELRNLAEPLYHYRQHPQSVNHRLGHRDAQTAEIIAGLRARQGLPPWPGRGGGAPQTGLALDECRRKWALEAVEGGHLATARANALAAVRSRPFNRKNWACLRYVWSRG